MREINYKAWTGKEMLHDVLPVNDSAVITDMQNPPSEAFVLYRHDIKNIIEFTGFYCKKTKVYDGWILKHPKSTEPEEKGWIVVWKDFGWKLKCVNLVNGEELFTEFSDYFANDCDIVGNIYENPELLS